MKIIIACILTVLLAFPAFAADAGLRVLVVDKDPKGTNVRESPSGKVIRVIPHTGKTDAETEMRAVTILSNQKDWFKVLLDDGTGGWMHKTVLGSCSSGTEDGAPHVYAEPTHESKSFEMEADTPLFLLSGPVKADGTIWAEFSFSYAPGEKASGWFSQEVLFSNPYNDCHRK